MVYSEILEGVLPIVREASSLMVDASFEVEMKDGCENIVTSSDIAVQDFLCSRLSGLLPGCGFICEEEDVNDAEKEYVWIIDPIDGTANYARGLAECCISVGLKHLQEMVLGVVYCPGRNELYSAYKGGGAFLNGKPMKVSSRDFSDAMLYSAMSTYHKEHADVCSEIIMETYHQCNDVRRYGSAALELCLLASGKAELYFEFRLMPWDYAASVVILREAGGCISDLDGKIPNLESPDLVCAANSAENCDRLLDIVRGRIKVLPY